MKERTGRVKENTWGEKDKEKMERREVIEKDGKGGKETEGGARGDNWGKS